MSPKKELKALLKPWKGISDENSPAEIVLLRKIKKNELMRREVLGLFEAEGDIKRILYASGVFDRDNPAHRYLVSEITADLLSAGYNREAH